MPCWVRTAPASPRSPRSWRERSRPTSGADVLQGAGGQVRLALGSARGGHRHGVPGDQPRPVHDGRAKPLSRQREVSQPAARHLYLGAAVPAVAQLSPSIPRHWSATLGAAKRQMVEIARAVHLNAEVIIFDEPTAALTPEEKRHFFALMRRLKQRGVSIMFISHALEEALAHVRPHHGASRRRRSGDRPRPGIRSRQGDPRHGRTHAVRTRFIVQRARQMQLRPAGEKVLSVQDISHGRCVRNTSFSIFAGQITGVFGLIGSGRTETAKVVAGITSGIFCAAARSSSMAVRCATMCRARR